MLDSTYDMAPLHNPPNVLGIEAAMEVLPNIPHMAIMDTAWHQTMPSHAYMYALPYEWYEKYGFRRYGFHGTSFLYVAKWAALLLGKDPFHCNLICLHIGNGVSANAIKNGVSYDTSMGLTPLEGLVMGTRSGDHDAAIDLMIMEKEGKTPKQMNDILNKKSGILGVTGKFTDRRDVQKAAGEGDELAKTRNAETEISAADSKVKIFVIPTDEERVNIEDVAALLEGKYDEHTRFTYRFQSPDYENSQREQDFQRECEKKPAIRKIQVKPKKR